MIPLRYLLRRLLLLAPTLLGVTLLSFAVINLAPGGPVEQQVQRIRLGAGSSAMGLGGAAGAERQGVSAEVMEALRRQYGFDKPVLTRYGLWLERLSRLDFGDSFVHGRPALAVIAERFPVSLQFGLTSFVLTYLVSIGLGLLMARNEGKLLDRALGLGLLVASSIPVFMVGLVLLVLLCGGSFLTIFPVGYLQSDDYDTLSALGKIADRAHHFVLPLFCYTLGSFTGLALLCRNAVADELRKDYVRAARARGVPERTILVRHALRNALVPLSTGIGGVLAVFLSGSVLVESVFQLDGIGLLALRSILDRDYNVIMALIVLSSVALTLGNLLGDLVYALVDPRIEYR